MPKISIIIAMYNIEDYIAKCLTTCLTQEKVSSKDYEIIVVNDGSTDNSLGIATEILLNIPNARIITRENGGLSEARNTGLEYANGEYVWFIDGDDAISPKAVSTLLYNIDKTHSDALIINFSTFENDNIIDSSHFFGLGEAISGVDYHFTYCKILPMMAWLTVYRKVVLLTHQVKFLSGIIHEDMEFSIRAHHVCSSIVFVNETLYLYRIARIDSIMAQIQKNNLRSAYSILKIIESHKSFFKNVDNTFTRRLYGIYATYFFSRVYGEAFLHNEESETIVKEYKDKLYKDMWRSQHWKRRGLLLMILFMPQCVIKRIFNILEHRHSKLL